MAGLFPGICNSQNHDINGQPLKNSKLTVYDGGTLTLSDVFQDIGLAIPAQNPAVADATGRLPFFYVADGVYRVILVDENGRQIYDYPQVSSIGASSSGGGGTAVDPTTVFQTGFPFWRPLGGALAGWVRMNARTIGSSVSGASERANADCQPLFLHLWNYYSDAKCPVVTGRGVSAAADWGADKAITLPDMRGKGPFGIDGMGNSRANIIPDDNVTSIGDTADTALAYGGEANHILAVTEMPAHAHVVTDAGHVHAANDPSHVHANSLTDPGHRHRPDQAGAAFATIVAGGGSVPTGGNASQGATTSTDQTGIILNNAAAFTGITIGLAPTGITLQQTGGDGSHNNMSPFALGTWYMKL